VHLEKRIKGQVRRKQIFVGKLGRSCKESSEKKTTKEGEGRREMNDHSNPENTAKEKEASGGNTSTKHERLYRRL